MKKQKIINVILRIIFGVIALMLFIFGLWVASVLGKENLFLGLVISLIISIPIGFFTALATT